MKTITKDILEPGLACYLDLTCELNSGEIVSGGWVIIEEILPQGLKGKLEGVQGLEGEILIFDFEDVKRLRGSEEWNIDNLFVKVSKEVLEGSEVGFFYNSFEDNPLNYGRRFYSINEINKDKSLICVYDLKLSKLCEREPALKKVLPEFAYLGVIKHSGGAFKVLKERDIINKPRKVFPSFYELE